MKNRGETTSDKLILHSPARVPVQFTIEVTSKAQTGSGYQLTVVRISSLSDAKTKGVYQFDSAIHSSYLDLFEKLAADFGLRVPQNRKQTLKRDFKIDYKEILLGNLTEGMLYGYGDPAITRVKENGTPAYYLLSTSNDAPDAFPIVRSDNLIDWTFAGYVFPKGKTPEWAASGEIISDYWAPEMHEIGNQFRVYFVARDKSTRELCIGMAESSRPDGPFTAKKEPMLKGNVIDPHIFQDTDNSTYLFWKEDNNDVWPGALLNLFYNNPELISEIFPDEEDQVTVSFIVTLWPWMQRLEPMERFMAVQVFIEAVISRFSAVYNLLKQLAQGSSKAVNREIWSVLHFMKTPVFAQRLSADGETFVGQRTKIIENDLEWEAHLIEGMWLTLHRDKYYLFYTGNDFSTDRYGVGVATSDSVLGPYKKLTDPILQSTERWMAPGHPSVTIAPDGQPAMFFHAYFPGEAGYKQFRALLSVTLRFEAGQVSIE